jgi:hypothetical protein
MIKMISRSAATIIVLICLVPTQGRAIDGDCLEMTCYCGIQAPCDADCIKLCGDKIGSETPNPGTVPEPSYDDHQKEERLRNEREIQDAAEEAARRDRAKREQFERNKKNALDLLKTGSDRLGIKGVADSDVKLKGSSRSGTNIKEIEGH